MILKKYEIRVDIRNLTRPRIEYVQGDTNVYPLYINLTDEGVPIDVSETKRISLILLTPKSNSVIEGACETLDGVKGQVVYHVGSNEIAEEGTVVVELKLFAEGDRLLTSTRFTFEVRASILTDGAVESSTQFGLLQEIINTDWTGDPGKDGDFSNIVDRGEWDSETAYSVNDLVRYEAKTCVSRSDDNLGNSQGGSDQWWALIAQDGPQGKQGDQGLRGKQGEPGVGVPPTSISDAGKSLIVKPDGSGVEFGMVSGLPVGSIIAFGGTKVPFGYLECNGALLSRAAYAGLFDAIGTTWGTNTASDFRIPNFTEAERFLRSRSATLPVGTLQGDAIRNITGEIGVGSRMGVTLATGSFKPQTTGTVYYNGVNSNQAPISALLDVSLQVPTADENRPKSAVVMYCIKMLDSVIDPEQILAGAVISEIANKANRSEVQELAGTRIWVSGKYTPVLNTPTIVTHGLNINPLTCKFDVVLECVIAQAGYSVGDIILAGWSNAPAANAYYPTNLSLSATAIQVTTPVLDMSMMKKTTGAIAVLTLANWRYIFRIWY